MPPATLCERAGDHELERVRRATSGDRRRGVHRLHLQRQQHRSATRMTRGRSSPSPTSHHDASKCLRDVHDRWRLGSNCGRSSRLTDPRSQDGSRHGRTTEPVHRGRRAGAGGEARPLRAVPGQRREVVSRLLAVPQVDVGLRSTVSSERSLRCRTRSGSGTASGFGFRYYDVDGNEIASGANTANRAKIARVDLIARARTARTFAPPAFRTARTQQYRDSLAVSVMIRNRQ